MKKKTRKGYKLDTFRFHEETGKNWFMNRVMDEWNKLSRYVVKANTIENLQLKLDVFMNGKGLW